MDKKIIHDMPCWEYKFWAIVQHKKKCLVLTELKEDPYYVGDYIRLMEMKGATAEYTKNTCMVKITDIEEIFGDGSRVLSIRISQGGTHPQTKPFEFVRAGDDKKQLKLRGI